MISDNAEVPVHFHFDCMIRWELVSMRVNFVKSSQGTLCFVCTMQTNGISIIRKISNIYIDIFQITIIIILDKFLIGGLKYV